MAQWIYHPDDNRETRLVPVFRRRFQVRRGLIKAVLRLTAHGIYEAELNGQPVTEDKFTPGFTSYYHRVQVQGYDVAAILREGENELRVTVGRLIESQSVPVREKERFTGRPMRDSAGNRITFEYVAGIRPTFDAPGFREFELKPVVGGSLTWAEGSYKTRYGVIRSRWERDGAEILYSCQIPENTMAHLTLPDGKTATLPGGKYTFNCHC